MGRSLCLRARTWAWLCAGLMVAGMLPSAAEPQPSVADQYRAIWQSHRDEQKLFGASNWITKSGERIDPFKHTEQHIAKFLALAEKHPKDPVTGENLLRISSFFGGFQGLDRVETILRRDWPGAGDYLDVLKGLKIGEQGYVSKPDERASRFLAIAKKHPQTPVAVQALVWVVHPIDSGPDFDYPHERSLVKRLEGKPFALLGVNSDSKGRLQRAMKQENLTWRSWWDGGSTEGPIQRAWSIHSWPTTYVLDHKGVIRYKDVREKSMDEVVDALLKEMGTEASQR